MPRAKIPRERPAPPHAALASELRLIAEWAKLSDDDSIQALDTAVTDRRVAALLVSILRGGERLVGSTYVPADGEGPARIVFHAAATRDRSASLFDRTFIVSVDLVDKSVRAISAPLIDAQRDDASQLDAENLPLTVDPSMVAERERRAFLSPATVSHAAAAAPGATAGRNIVAHLQTPRWVIKNGVKILVL